MRVLSIQSAVAWGHVGNSAAVFALERLGIETLAVDTVQFSNHPGHGQWAGMALPASHVHDVIEGLASIGALKQCDGLVSGYLGEPGTADAVVAAVEGAGAGALYLCDPVMGDSGPGLYVHPDLPGLFRERLLPLAGIVTPNLFELGLLTGAPVADAFKAERAARSLLARGPRAVVVTSLPGPDADTIACLAVTAERSWRAVTPCLAFPAPVNGAGDLLSALLLAHALKGAAIDEALSLALSALFGVLERTRDLGRRELALIEAQDCLVRTERTVAIHAFP